MKMLPRRNAVWFYIALKKKTYKMKAWTGSASRIPHQAPAAKGRAADPGCSHLHPAASPCSSRTKWLSSTHRDVWNWGGGQQMDPMLSTCPNATAITQGTLPGVGQKAGPNYVMVSHKKQPPGFFNVLSFPDVISQSLSWVQEAHLILMYFIPLTRTIFSSITFNRNLI